MKKKGKKMIMVLLIMGLSISATGCKGIMKEEPDATKGVKNDGDLEGIYVTPYGENGLSKMDSSTGKFTRRL